MSVCRIPRPAAPSDESVDATLAALPSGTRFCVSEPSARDGEHWPHLGAFLARLQRLNPGVRVALDATYVGLVRSPTAFPVDHPNVDTVLFSLSKPFGLYRYRVGGAFTRLTWPAFAYNHWFNNLFGLKLGLKLMGRHARGELPGRYAEHQAALVAHLVSRGLLPADAEPSNVLLLARSRQELAEPRYNRAPGLSRYCLTPGLHHLVHGGSLS
jgi:hypothetical protein